MSSDSEKEPWDWPPFVLDGVEFVPSMHRLSTERCFTLVKPKPLLDEYLALVEEFPHPRIVELGIFQGGSAALLALAAQPEKLVALELDPAPVEPLMRLIAERGLDATIRPHFGVDQADRDRLSTIMAREFGDQPLDLVIDDASHLYQPTLASFEQLFPRLRPGGVFFIEDWTAEDIWSVAIARGVEDGSVEVADLEQAIEEMLAAGEVHRPISALGLELTLALAQSPDVLTEVRLTQRSITVRRGHQPLDPETFHLGDLYHDYFGMLTRPPADA